MLFTVLGLVSSAHSPLFCSTTTTDRIDDDDDDGARVREKNSTGKLIVARIKITFHSLARFSMLHNRSSSGSVLCVKRRMFITNKFFSENFCFHLTHQKKVISRDGTAKTVSILSNGRTFNETVAPHMLYTVPMLNDDDDSSSLYCTLTNIDKKLRLRCAAIGRCAKWRYN